jgi:uncharacterized protein (DUF1778 family)
MNLTRRLSLRIPEFEERLIRKAASLNSQTVSDYLRTAALKQSKLLLERVPTPDDEEKI